MLDRLRTALFWSFLAVFILGLFNRELTVIGIDLRVFVGVFATVLLAWNVCDALRKKVSVKRSLKGIDTLVVAFLALSLLVNIMWLWNGLELNEKAFIPVMAASAYHLLVYVAIYLNRHYLHWKYISLLLIASGIILMVSIIISYVGVDLRYLGSDYPGGYIDKLAPSFISEARYGGYAQDPNYASLFMVIVSAVAVHAYRRTKKYMYLAVLPVAAFCLLLSASKAIIIMIPIALIVIAVYNKKVSAWLKYALLAGIIVGTLVLALTNIRISDIQTLNTRISLWNAATTQVADSPIIGSGLTAARSAAAETKWYVQPHSSVVQIMVDMGFVGLALIFLLLRRNLFSSNKLVVFVTLIFLVHFATHETIYQAYFLFMIVLLPLFLRSPDVLAGRKKADVYVVNTLSNGGAERVVQNMANNSTADRVIVYTLYNSGALAYKLHNGIEVINLGGSGKKWQAVLLADRLSRELDVLTGEYSLQLATTHLPFAHLVTRLTKYSGSFMYVMHGMYGVGVMGTSGIITKLLYRGQMLVSVSKGLARGDLIEKYGIKARKLTTIYNPIDFAHIDEKLSEQGKRKKQILFVGRFSPQKNPLAVLEAFKKSQLANDGYTLVMLGEGELRQRLEQYITRHSLASNVTLEGFVDNPFKYMQESAMLLIASDYEAFTMVALEALYCNCPVVAYNINYGIDEVLTGDLHEYIAPVGDSEAMGRVMRKAAEYYPGDLHERVTSMVGPDKIMQKYYDTYRRWMS